MNKSFRCRVRFYVILLLSILSMSTYFFVFYQRADYQSSVDIYYATKARRIIEDLKNTEWGKGDRGQKILGSFKEKELRIAMPKLVYINNKKHYTYDRDIVEGPSCGLTLKNKGVFTIYISTYHLSELSENRKIIVYADSGIPEDEFISILVDELLSRYWEGKYFVDGEASIQEEIDAWNASEEAVKAYYRDDNYKVNYHSGQPPSYGPSNPSYHILK